jgi:hypothetical protein
MDESRRSAVARVSVERSASADLQEVCSWLIESQGNPLRLDVAALPALGRSSVLRLALPITAPRAVLCAVWLIEDVAPGGCLVAGQLRFVAHPTGSSIRLSFSGRTATASSSGLPPVHAEETARQPLAVIAESIALRRSPARQALSA